MKIPALSRFDRKMRRMRRLSAIPFDPRFNAFHWISDCWFLTYQIEYSYREMREAAKRYQRANRPGDNPSDSIPRLSYYADNTIVRLLSFADKLALCLLSYFEDFDPNGDAALFGVSDVVRELKNSTRHARPAINQAVAILGPLAQRRPAVLKRYRDYKIHRREPRIEMFGVQAHHDVSYLFRLDQTGQEQAKIRDWGETQRSSEARAIAREV